MSVIVAAHPGRFRIGWARASGLTPRLLAFWPVYALAAAALAAMLIVGGSMHDHRSSGGAGAGTATFDHVHGQFALDGSTGPTPLQLIALTGWWACMTVGMMLPSATPALARVRLVVPRRRRTSAAALFSVAFVATWLPGTLLAAIVLSGDAPRSAVVAAMAAAVLWELTSVKRRALRACHRYPVISARFPAVYRDCLSYGIRRAQICAVTCGPVMLAVLVAGHPAWLVLVVTAVLVAQNTLVDGSRHLAWSAAVFAVAGGALVLLG